MTLGGTYSTGTVSATNGSALVTSAGALWNDVVEGDWIQIGVAVAVIDSVNTDYDEITLKGEWLGDTAENADYRILKMSWQRFDPALTQAKLRQFIASIEAAGLFLFVSGDVPDPSLGEDGQFALKTNEPNAPWLLWLKVDGIWVAQGSPLGLNWQGAWNPETAYFVGSGVSRGGKSYIAIQGNTDKAPESYPLFWGVLTTGGDVYDVGGFSPDRPGSGENILSWLMNRTVTFPAGLTDSQARAGTPATSDAVFAIQKTSTAAPATVTISLASPGVVTHVSHGRSNGDRVLLTTTGLLPTGLSVRRWYYLVNVTTHTYQLATSADGTAINTTASQSGVHSAIYGVQFGTITVAAGATKGTFASNADTVFVADEILDVVGPYPRDPTLADMHVTLYGFR